MVRGEVKPVWWNHCVHGANTSFLCDGESVRFAKRMSLLEADEKFYDYPKLLERYSDMVIALAKDVMGRYVSSVFELVLKDESPRIRTSDGKKDKISTPNFFTMRITAGSTAMTPQPSFFAI